MRYGRKSREVRRKLDRPAWIVIDGAFGVRKCTMVDISETGAQIRVDNPSSVPKYFTVSFSQTDRRGKNCKVVWRSTTSIGIQFVP
jgi:hypothetical protein